MHINKHREKAFEILNGEIKEICPFNNIDEVPTKVLQTYMDKYENELRNRDDIIYVELDQNQHSKAGYALMELYQFDKELLMRHGYFANGCSNTMSIADTPERLLEWVRSLYDRISKRHWFFLDYLETILKIPNKHIKNNNYTNRKWIKITRFGDKDFNINSIKDCVISLRCSTKEERNKIIKTLNQYNEDLYNINIYDDFLNDEEYNSNDVFKLEPELETHNPKWARYANSSIVANTTPSEFIQKYYIKSDEEIKQEQKIKKIYTAIKNRIKKQGIYYNNALLIIDNKKIRCNGTDKFLNDNDILGVCKIYNIKIK